MGRMCEGPFPYYDISKDFNCTSKQYIVLDLFLNLR